MMTTGSRIRSAFLIFGGLGLGWFMASAGQAQVIHPDQIIGVPLPQTESSHGNGPASPEPAASDMEKGFDRQMRVPETGSSGGMDMNMLKTPDTSDAENARESDSRSSVSF